MPVIRCQACGKPNPDFLDVCQYCEARLKPMGSLAPLGSADETLVSPPAPPPPSGEGVPAGNMLDRLRAVGGPAPDAEPDAEFEDETAPAGEGEAGVGDWLSRLRGVQGPGTAGLPAERDAAAEPDWMWGGQAAEPEAPAEPPPAEPALDSAPPASQPPAAPAAPPESDLPDWLQDKEAPPLPEAGQPPAKPRRKMTDWLNASGGLGGTPPPDVDDVPDWLKGLAGSSAEAGQPPAEMPPRGPSPADSVDAPDWLKTLRGGDQPSGPAGPRQQELPAWMRAGEPADEPAPAEAAPEPPAAAEPPPPAWSEPPRTPTPVQRMEAKPSWLRSEPPVEAHDEPPAPEPPPAAPPAATPPAAKAPAPPPSDATVPSTSLAPPPEGANLPDWLRDIITPAAEAAAAETAEPPALSQPPRKKKMTDWLGAAPPPTDHAATDPNAELPDWLRNLSAAQTGAPEDMPAAEPTADLPEWLRTVSGEPAPAAPAESAAEPAQPTLAATPVEDMPDWLRAMSPAEPAAEAADTLAADIAAAESVAGASAERPSGVMAPSPPTLAATPAEDLPDWLRAMSPAEAEPAEAEPADTVAGASAERPSGVMAPPTLPATTVEPAETLAATPAEDLPDWLRALSPTELAAAESAAALDDETLDWLDTLSGAGAAAAEPAAELAEAALDAEAFIEPAAAFEAAPEPEPEFAAAEDTVAGAISAPSAPPEQPDWMAEFAAASQSVTLPEEPPPAMPAEAAPEGEIQPTPDAELPDWLRALRGMPAAEAEAAEETPDWLRALRGQPAEDIPAPAEAEAEAEPVALEADLAPAATPAELPAWLAAMRPVDIEQTLTPEADTYQETMGVLSGMRGVLRAEPVAARLQHAAPAVQHLELSDAHSANVRLLAELAPAEPIATVRRAAGVPLRSRVERWVVFGILALAIILAQFQFAGQFAPPSRITDDTRHAYEAVAGLAALSGAPGTPPRPVLIALDYEAGLQGELNPGVQAIMGQALAQGNPVVMVSTKPEGAAVAQGLLERSAAAYGEQVVNLGYLPGGPVGLLQFASAPRSSFTGDFSGGLADVWAASALAGVEQFDDFGVVVVAASSAQALRGWIEQTQFVAPAVPLVAVVSAGAEPMTRPYLQGADPQLAGMVSGLAGAAQYETQASLPGGATALWPALGGGLWAAVVLIAAGNLVFGVLALIRRRRT